MTNQHTEYRPIPGFPGFRIGRDQTVWTTWKKIGLGRGRGSAFVRGSEWRKLNNTMRSNGYLDVGIYKNKSIHRVYIHHLMLTVFVCKRPPNMECRHLNGIKTDNRICNLRWGTSKENRRDSYRHGTAAFGDHSKNAVLHSKDIPTIRSRFLGGDSVHSIAPDYGVNIYTIYDACSRRTWKHVA